MKHPPSRLEREPHPAIETLERVLSSGVMVDFGPDDWRHGLWADVPTEGLLSEADEAAHGTGDADQERRETAGRLKRHRH